MRRLILIAGTYMHTCSSLMPQSYEGFGPHICVDDFVRWRDLASDGLPQLTEDSMRLITSDGGGQKCMEVYSVCD